MIRLCAFYAKEDNARFDHQYYREHHVPLCIDIWDPESAEIDEGVDGPYMVSVHFLFSSEEALEAAMSHPRLPEIEADMKNYTDQFPLVQASRVVESFGSS